MNIILNFPSPEDIFLMRLGLTQYVGIDPEFIDLSIDTLLIAPSHLGPDFSFVIDQNHPTPFHVPRSPVTLLRAQEYHTYSQSNQYLLTESQWPYQTSRLPCATPNSLLTPLTSHEGQHNIWLNPFAINHLEQLDSTQTYIHIGINLAQFDYHGTITLHAAYQLVQHRIGETIILHEYLFNQYLTQLPELNEEVIPFYNLPLILQEQIWPLRDYFYQVNHADYHHLKKLFWD